MIAKVFVPDALDPLCKNRYRFRMAKRPAEDDDDDDKIVRKRRYKPQKTDNEEDDAPSPLGKGRQTEDEDEDEFSISTGNVYLDIALDFRDDCIDWTKEHFFAAVVISVVTFLIISTLSYLFIQSWVRYLNRPSLEIVNKAYNLGYYPETYRLAEEALQYVPPSDPVARCAFLFFQGAALCAIAERVIPVDQRDYYLTAANYLKESAVYNFLPDKAAEGWYLLGKSLYHCGELEQCRDPLRIALDDGYPNTKRIYWYLANAYILGASPDLIRSRQYLQRFQNEPTALEEEIAESRLLETMIALHIDGITPAEEVLAKVPRFGQFALMRNFVVGQIELFKARELIVQAIDLETDPNPRSLRDLPVAPAPVRPELPAVPVVPPEEIPMPPVPVLPMDDAVLRDLMRSHNPPAPVLGSLDGTTEIQQRFAEIRSQYAQNHVADEIIVLESDDTTFAPVPTSPPPEIGREPLESNPVLNRAKEFRDVAAFHYQQAINRFVDVIDLARVENPWGRSARLLIGICYTEMGKPKMAEEYFRGLIETFPSSSEAAAAHFLLGEHDRTMGNADAAFRSFAEAFENLRRNPAYASLWIPKALIADRANEMVRSDIEKQNYDGAVKLLDMLNGVLSPAEIVRLRGETYESWAELLQLQAETTFGEPGSQIVRESESKRRSAGAAFAALAQLSSATLEFSELLWRGAENYRLGKDYRRGIVEYQKFMQVNFVEHRPEVFYRLGEMYLHLDFLAEAADTLEEALKDFPSHYLVPQMRLVLSHVYYEQQNWEKAKALLQLNLVGDTAPSSATYRDSMYELGRISFAQGDLDAAIPYLEDALKVHPNAIQAADASYLLAQAYFRQAENLLGELTDNPTEEVRQWIESNVQTRRLRGLSYLDRTEQILADRQQAMGLTEAEELMRRNVLFFTCSVMLKMEQYEQVIPRLNAAATIYQDREEALDALVKMAYALRMIGNDTEAQTTLRRAEVILSQLEKTGTIPEGTNWRNVIGGQETGTVQK